jgi:membrane protease YdiL (CAAX protease family)
MILVDVLRLQSQAGYIAGAVISAVLFALYHNIGHPGGGADLRLLAFYSIAGLYFAFLFAWRGFGIVVAAHSIYDAIVLLSIRQ